MSYESHGKRLLDLIDERHRGRFRVHIDFDIYRGEEVARITYKSPSGAIHSLSFEGGLRLQNFLESIEAVIEELNVFMRKPLEDLARDLASTEGLSLTIAKDRLELGI